MAPGTCGRARGSATGKTGWRRFTLPRTRFPFKSSPGGPRDRIHENIGPLSIRQREPGIPILRIPNAGSAKIGEPRMGLSTDSNRKWNPTFFPHLTAMSGDGDPRNINLCFRCCCRCYVDTSKQSLIFKGDAFPSFSLSLSRSCLEMEGLRLFSVAMSCGIWCDGRAQTLKANPNSIFSTQDQE